MKSFIFWVVFGGTLFLCGIIFCAVDPVWVGISLIVGGLLAIAISIGLYIKRRVKERKLREEAEALRLQHIEIHKGLEKTFNHYLEEQEFERSKEVGAVIHEGTCEEEDTLLIDYNKKKWCKYLDPNIFQYSDIASVSIHKTKKEVTKRSGSSSSSSYGSSYRYNKHGSSSRSHYGSRSSESCTEDVSTYEVFVITNVIDCPQVTFSCETSEDNASAIKAAIEIMMREAKATGKSDLQ